MHFLDRNRIDCDKWKKNGCGGLKRFIRYLYEYQDGQRVRNVGFVKVEQDQDQSVLHIHGKGLRLEGDKKLELYLIFNNGKECTGVCQGEIENVNPAVNYRLSYGKNDTGSPSNYDLIDGILMQNNRNRKFAAVWDDMPVDVENMRIWQADTGNETEEIKEQVEMPVQEMAEIISENTEEEQIQQTQEVMIEHEVTIEETEVISVGMAETPELQETAEEKTDISAKADNIEIDNQTANTGRRYTKIRRQELSRLPRCEWKLANNSFLLHGYYNYHHLILIDETESMWLGVPGVYHQKEARAAEAFGFATFVRISETEMVWEEGEKNRSDDFGYWCRQVRR